MRREWVKEALTPLYPRADGLLEVPPVSGVKHPRAS